MYPDINEQLCTDCGLCLRVCAGSLSSPAFRQSVPTDPFRGDCVGAWVGKSNNGSLYTGGQSGGVVSQLLIHLLESGEVDACVVVKMEMGTPPRPTAFLARTAEDVMEAQKSKYCPVPILQVLRQVKANARPIALVGLGCHLHGLRLLENLDVALGSFVKVRIGLICESVYTLAAVDYFLEKASVKEMGAKLVFKDKMRTGYPGKVTVEDERGRISVVPISERMALKQVLTPARCRLCFDKMNVLADLTIGDPWGIDGIDKQNGESIVIARTAAGASLIEKELGGERLSLRAIDYNDILRGQRIAEKRADWEANCRAWVGLGRELPGSYSSLLTKALATRKSEQRCQRRLLSALALDQYSSRAAVIAYVRRELALRRFRRYALAPLRLARRFVRRNRQSRKRSFAARKSGKV